MKRKKAKHYLSIGGIVRNFYVDHEELIELVRNDEVRFIYKIQDGKRYLLICVDDIVDIFPAKEVLEREISKELKQFIMNSASGAIAGGIAGLAVNAMTTKKSQENLHSISIRSLRNFLKGSSSILKIKFLSENPDRFDISREILGYNDEKFEGIGYAVQDHMFISRNDAIKVIDEMQRQLKIEYLIVDLINVSDNKYEARFGLKIGI